MGKAYARLIFGVGGIILFIVGLTFVVGLKPAMFIGIGGWFFLGVLFDQLIDELRKLRRF